MNSAMARAALIFTLLFSIAAWTAEDLFAGAPPAPPGYDDYLQARAAVLTGKVPLATIPDSVPEGIVHHDDVIYATHDGVELSLDIFVPENITEAAPLLLFIHGGGWSKGKKEDYLPYNVAFSEQGYVTASVQYRLSPEHHFPAAIQDVKCAIGWLRDHARDYKIDPARVVVLGGSAGGHLALLAGYAQNEVLECPDAHTTQNTRVIAIVNFYGVTDLTTKLGREAREVRDFIGQPYEEAKTLFDLGSPMYHLDATDPPTLTFHGTVDELVPISQADRLHARLDALEIPNYYDRIDGWPHTMDAAKPIHERAKFIISRFLEKHVD